MADAPWRTERMTYHWGVDWEGNRRGFSWCGLCGASCDVGVVVQCIPFEARGSAFFCSDCIRRMGMVVDAATNAQASLPRPQTESPN